MGVAAFPDAKQLCLLLRPVDNEQPRRVFVGEVVSPVPLGEVHRRQALVARQSVHRLIERLGDTGQRRGRSDRQPQLAMRIADQPDRILQLQSTVAPRSSQDSDRTGGQPQPTNRAVRFTRRTGHSVLAAPRPTGAPRPMVTNDASRRGGAKPR